MEGKGAYVGAMAIGLLTIWLLMLGLAYKMGVL